ncbi:MAG: T9SS type A sorting domain-containing protein [Candidatus Saccharibacteria bacterium]
MKKIIGLLIIQLTALIQPCGAQNLVNQQMPWDDSLNFQMTDGQIKELEAGLLSSNHLKSGIADSNMPDSTQLYQFNTSGDSVLSERTLFTFNTAGKIKTELQYKWYPSINRWLDFKYENTYDRSGRISEKNFTGWYLQSFSAKENYNGTYYEKDTTVAFPYTRTFSYQYNQLGKPKNVWRFTFDQYDIPEGTPYSCYYDAKGNITSINSAGSLIINNVNYGMYAEDYIYDSENRLMTVTQSRNYQYNYVPVWFCSSKIKYEYTYDSDKRVSSIQSYYFSFKANEWRNTSKVDYAYQDNGNLDSRLYSIIDSTPNELMPADRTDFKYNKNNKIQCREDYAWSKTTSLWEIRKKLYYYYNNSDPKARTLENLQASETHFCIFPNPVNDVLWIEYTDDINSFLYIYNSKGQCVKTSMMERGVHSIDLSTLAKGIYFYKIDLNNGFNSGTLIVE